MAKIPLPPDTPAWRKKKIVKPEDMPMSDAMQQYLREKTDAETAKSYEDESAAEAKKALDTRGYSTGGMVRGCGMAVKGHGKGKVY